MGVDIGQELVDYCTVSSFRCLLALALGTPCFYVAATLPVLRCALLYMYMGQRALSSTLSLSESDLTRGQGFSAPSVVGLRLVSWGGSVAHARFGLRPLASTSRRNSSSLGSLEALGENFLQLHVADCSTAVRIPIVEQRAGLRLCNINTLHQVVFFLKRLDELGS